MFLLRKRTAGPVVVPASFRLLQSTDVHASALLVHSFGFCCVFLWLPSVKMCRILLQYVDCGNGLTQMVSGTDRSAAAYNARLRLVWMEESKN